MIKELDKNEVSALVCEALECPKEIWVKSHKADIVLARQLVWWLYYKAGYGHSEISRRFDWNRATILHGINRIESFVKNYKDFIEMCDNLRKQVLA